ncbi:unnamed protein product [Blepharisma stoltei]|uniref:FAD-binding domain-containing protein n=1 Tax=Blepharisma stoltei TaxID=1481888 RepID=A0AAU9J5C2_9CILI|nr:unnamed protein product [Blepharisma stoltei]
MMKRFFIRTFSSKRAIIIGAGLSGPLSALFLKQANIESIIFEKENFQPDNSGIPLIIPTNGAKILNHIDIYHQIKAFSFPLNKKIYWNYKNKLKIIDESDNEAKYGAESIIIKKSRLHKAILNELNLQGIKIHYEKEISHIENTEKSLKVIFKDNSEVEGDFLIGSDGTFSQVRNIIFPNFPSPVYDKTVRFCGFSTCPTSPNTADYNVLICREGVFSFKNTAKDQVYWTATIHSHISPEKNLNNNYISADEWKHKLIGTFAKDAIFIKDIIFSTVDNIGIYPVYNLSMPEKWYDGRVCLIGDAAHSISPFSLQEASLGFEDAFLLAKCLKMNEISEGFQKFEDMRKLRTKKIITFADLAYASFKSRGLKGFLQREFIFPYYAKRILLENPQIYSYNFDF